MGIRKRLKGGVARKGVKALIKRLEKQRSRLLEWADRNDRQLQAVREVQNRLEDMRSMGAVSDVDGEIERYRDVLERMEEEAGPDGGLTEEQAETFKSTVNEIYDRAKGSVEIDG